MHDALALTLTELRDRLADGSLSPVELMEAVWRRIEDVDPRLNAVVVRADRDSVMEQARAAEARLERGERRPLEGIPLGVKDLEDAAGLPTSQGSMVFKGTIAQRDSTQVERLKAAGAIVVGKTNAPEFGSTAFTKNRPFGVTRNPWDLACSPGGSSGGASAALAGNILPLVTGSDGGGSVRIPACLVGAFGLKPSYGRIPNGPSERWAWIDTVCHGPITKTVEDAALFMDQVAGPSLHDDSSLPSPGLSYVEAIQRPPQGLRIAHCRDFGYAVVAREVAEAVERAVKVLEGLGHAGTEVDGGPPIGAAGWVLINNLDSYCHLQPYLAEHESEFGRGFIQSVKTAADVTPEMLERTIRRRAQINAWCAEIFGQYDVLLTPTLPFDAMPAKGPYPTEIDGKEAHYSGPGAFTIPFNLSLHPAGSVRVGLSSRGMPMGMQIVAGRHRDDVVLQVAKQYQDASPWHPEWPTLEA